MANGNDDLPADIKQERGSRLWFAFGSVLVVLMGLVSVPLLLLVWPPKLGIGLAGGVRLVYEVADERPGAAGAAYGTSQREVTPELLQALDQRLDPSKTKQVIVRRRASNQVEILLPALDAPDYNIVKRSVSAAGFLQFLIVANSRDHGYLISRAGELAEDPATKETTAVHDKDGNLIGVWSRVSRDSVSGAFRLAVGSYTLRDSTTGKMLDVPKEHRSDDERQFTAYCNGLGIQEIDMLLAADDGYDVTGSDLGSVGIGFDETSRPCLYFSLSEEGKQRFAGLTTEYGPQGTFLRQLAIVLDNQVLSAPNLQEPIVGGRARITGQFTRAEVEFFANVLRAGSLPIALKDQPLEESKLAPDPAAIQTARRSVLTGVIVLALVWLFMLARYRWFGAAGVLASFVQIALTLVTLVALATFDTALIATIVIGAVGVAAGNTLVCEFIRTGRGLLVVCLVAALFLVLSVAAAGAYLAGDFEIRNIALAILATFLTALFVHALQWLFPAIGQRLLHRAG